MHPFFKAGKITYGTGLIVYGILQFYFGDFRPAVVPAWPVWMHSLMPVYISGAFMVVSGMLIGGLVPVKPATLKKVFLAAGVFFFLCFLCFHVPLNLFISKNSPKHLGVWVNSLKTLAFSGGALILASVLPAGNAKNNYFLFLAGRLFYSAMIILFGVSHFYYTDFIATLVPGWFGMPQFWTKFAGVALIVSGIFISFNILSRQVALLQAFMIFIWLIVLHLPRAIDQPWASNGNEMASAFDALLFTGVSVVIGYKTKLIKSS